MPSPPGWSERKRWESLGWEVGNDKEAAVRSPRPRPAPHAAAGWGHGASSGSEASSPSGSAASSSAARPPPKNRVPLCAARTLNAEGQSRVTLSRR